MAGSELAIIERQLVQLRPIFEQVVPAGVPAERVIRTVVISCERNARLLECTPSSIIQGATSFAVLGLEADGFTGQAFLIPFRTKGVMLAQPVVGYKGYSTIAARTGLTITGDVVREGDEFDFQKGTGAFVKHKPLLGRPGRRIIAAWSVAAAHNRPPAVEILDIDEIREVMSRSPAVRGGADTPWKDENIGFPAMAGKTARRRLARSLPLSAYQLAAGMDEAHEERGMHSFIHPEKGLVIEGEAQPIASAEPSLGPALPAGFVIKGLRGDSRSPTIEQWRAKMIEAINSIRSIDDVERFRDLNGPVLADLGEQHREHVHAVAGAFEERLRRG